MNCTHAVGQFLGVFFRMEQPYSHVTDLHEFWYLSIFRKSVLKIQV